MADTSGYRVLDGTFAAGSPGSRQVLKSLGAIAFGEVPEARFSKRARRAGGTGSSVQLVAPPLMLSAIRPLARFCPDER